jgi:CBS domain-containing protein
MPDGRRSRDRARRKELVMNVEQLMTRTVRSCLPDDSLNAAARIMWEADCGCVPIVEPADGRRRVVGMITDRDICMAAYTQGRPLDEIPIHSAMAKKVYCCHTTDAVETAIGLLEAKQVHRLPVLDRDDDLVGMLSLADIAREARREHAGGMHEVGDAQVAEVIEAISEPSSPHEMTVSA